VSNVVTGHAGAASSSAEEAYADLLKPARQADLKVGLYETRRRMKDP